MDELIVSLGRSGAGATLGVRENFFGGNLATVVSILLMVFSVTPASGQGRVTGTVYGSDGSPLPGARVDLIKESSGNSLSSVGGATIIVSAIEDKTENIVASMVSGAEGEYFFENVKKGNYSVRASYFECTPVSEKAVVGKGSEVSIDLSVDDRLMLEASKVSSSAISVKGDTTVFFTEAFTTGRERDLRDVLDKLPGIEVEDNSVTANGKSVSRILVEDQDLYQGSTSVPLDNIAAEDVEKVEVIENYSEYNIFSGFNTTDETVINVGVNGKARNRMKTDVDALGGIYNKYKLRASGLKIGSKTMFSIIGASNNIGEALISTEDVLQFSGGVSNLLSGGDAQSNVSKQFEAYTSFLSDGGDVKQKENSLVSLNLLSNPSDKLKISVNGIYNFHHHRSHSEQDYDYMSGLSYSDTSSASNRSHVALLSLKLQYLPSDDFNLIYTGRATYSSQKETGHNSLYSNNLTSKGSPDAFLIQNNLLAVKKFGEDLLNLEIDFDASRISSDLDFGATEEYYTDAIGLPDKYEYESKDRETDFSSQLFWLHRIGSDYYLRAAVKGAYDRQTFSSEVAESSAFSNDSRLEYSSGNADLLFGKDMGSLSFYLRLRYAHIHADNNLQRDFRSGSKNYFSPAAQVKYEFSQLHFIQLDYERTADTHPLTSLLDNEYINAYNSFTSSSADSFFSDEWKVSLSHAYLSISSGLTIYNTLSYSESEDSIVEDTSQDGYVTVTEKRVSPGVEKNFSLLSAAIYRFTFPLMASVHATYAHTETPAYTYGIQYKSKSDVLAYAANLETSRKRGLNGKISWNQSIMSYGSSIADYKMSSAALSGMLSWQNDSWYAGLSGSYEVTSVNGGSHRDNFEIGFELDYDLSDSVKLRLKGDDLGHLRERRQATGSVSSYYSVSSTTWYMPGYLLAGVTIKL